MTKGEFTKLCKRYTAVVVPAILLIMELLKLNAIKIMNNESPNKKAGNILYSLNLVATNNSESSFNMNDI